MKNNAVPDTALGLEYWARACSAAPNVQHLMQITIIGRFKDMVVFTRTGLGKSRPLENEKKNVNGIEKGNENEREAHSTNWITRVPLDRYTVDMERRLPNANQIDHKAVPRGKSLSLNPDHLKAGDLEAQSQDLDLALVLYKVTQNLLVRNWELLGSLNPHRNTLVFHFNLARANQHRLPTIITHFTTNLPPAVPSL